MPLFAVVKRLGADLKERRISRRTRGSLDRVLLVRQILPAFAAHADRILWIGCRRYTDDYPAMLEDQGAQCWTIDLDPAAAAFGHPSRHRTGDVADLPRVFHGLTFDAILCNGVFGYGVDTPDQQDAAISAMAAVASPGAHLLLGWNIDKIADPVTTGRFAPAFTSGSDLEFPERIQVPDSTHVYDLFKRRGPAN